MLEIQTKRLSPEIVVLEIKGPNHHWQGVQATGMGYGHFGA